MSKAERNEKRSLEYRTERDGMTENKKTKKSRKEINRTFCKRKLNQMANDQKKEQNKAKREKMAKKKHQMTNDQTKEQHKARREKMAKKKTANDKQTKEGTE